MASTDQKRIIALQAQMKVAKDSLDKIHRGCRNHESVALDALDQINDIEWASKPHRSAPIFSHRADSHIPRRIIGGFGVSDWVFYVHENGQEVAKGFCSDHETARREANHYAMMYDQNGGDVDVVVRKCPERKLLK